MSWLDVIKVYSKQLSLSSSKWHRKKFLQRFRVFCWQSFGGKYFAFNRLFVNVSWDNESKRLLGWISTGKVTRLWESQINQRRKKRAKSFTTSPGEIKQKWVKKIDNKAIEQFTNAIRNFQLEAWEKLINFEKARFAEAELRILCESSRFVHSFSPRESREDKKGEIIDCFLLRCDFYSAEKKTFQWILKNDVRWICGQNNEWSSHETFMSNIVSAHFCGITIAWNIEKGWFLN